jgi:hypothetical protein
MRAVFGPLTSYLTVELARDILQHTGGKAYAVFDQNIPFDLADSLQSRARVLRKLRVVKIDKEESDRSVYITVLWETLLRRTNKKRQRSV